MTPVWSWACALLAAAAVVDAHLGHHSASRRLVAKSASPSESTTWYHPDNSPYHELFRRGPATDGITYANVGSPAWSAPYPTRTPDSSAMPQAWKDALAAAVASGAIPNVSPAALIPNQNPQYPTGVDPMSPTVCSATYKCRLPDDIWDAPDGQVGISFDDGPIPQSSDRLYAFLQQNNIPATHFFIGVNILAAPNEFLAAYNMGGDIAVHTWTHPYMTTLSNADVVAQLGWTMELIHNSTGGRLPRFWRPPYGDSDIRVSAIAKHVFGMTTVIWNHDTEDWSMATTNLTLDTVETNLRSWYSGPKSPGLIILEHELTNDTVSGFIDTFPIAMQNGWKAVSVAQLDGKSTPYQNAQGPSGAPTPVADIVLAQSAPASSGAGSSSSASSQPTSDSSSAAAASSAASSSHAVSSGNKSTGASDVASGAAATIPSVAFTLATLSAAGLTMLLA